MVTPRPLPRMNRYSVWGEYTTPGGMYKCSKRGVFSSIAEAQIALKFALKGGDYVSMTFNGKDLNPSIQGHPRSCDHVSFCYGYNDNPLHFYIHTKDAHGNIERLSLKEHQYGPYGNPPAVIATPASLAAPLQAAEVLKPIVSPIIVKNASNASLIPETETRITTTTPVLADTPPTSPECDSKLEDLLSSAISTKQSVTSTTTEAILTSAVSEENLTPASSDVSVNLASVTSISLPKGLPGVIAAIVNPVATVSVKQVFVADAELVQPVKMLHSNVPITTVLVKDGKDQEDVACEIKEELINDDVDGAEGDDDGDFESESQYDARSLIGIKDGRWGNSLSKRVRIQARKSLMAVFRRTASTTKA